MCHALLSFVDDHAGALRELRDGRASYTMALDGESYPLHDVRIYKTATPVRGSASRGNVYTERGDSYRMDAGVDPAVSAKISGTMLGPSSRFGGLFISARTEAGRVRLECGLLSTSRTGGTLRMQLGIVGVR